jgi:hypothetical protein
VPRAPKKDDPLLRDRAHAAAAKLREIGENDLAETVDILIASHRWATVPSGGSTLTVWLDRGLKKRVQEGGRPVPYVVAEGLAKFMAGEFIPEPMARAAYGSGGKTSLTFRADADVWLKATEYGAAHAEELGWMPSASQVAAAYMAHLYPEPAPTE